MTIYFYKIVTNEDKAFSKCLFDLGIILFIVSLNEYVVKSFDNRCPEASSIVKTNLQFSITLYVSLNKYKIITTCSVLM